ncbi:NAD dependent epimerase/dehydratase [Macroventuria anomochaeta]|uniref:NAD dependent epimerase/dehydratase n=1 Tax=Macroventuria anomochaeta TaxID=301207 RepID=A0ACB6S9A9_9PLEO|nr:NAD dependent epimerase/dehydratase [Macroventuria anomochaeta]KAF2630587.1 NAD dependent epimerase/dehydratase [Macroventuria anomochaeta]
MSQPLIFITGATGFIGSHVVTQALSAGYKVRLSVRKEAQIDSLRKLFSEHAASLDFVVVPDFTSPDAFNKPLENVTYVFHLASPLPGNGSDFETDYLNPAVQGTIALLGAAKDVDTIKRIVIVSSVLALVPLDALITRKLIVKEGLNPSIPVDPQMSFPEDPRASGSLKYHASKILAHRATLSWVSAAKPSFTIVTLHPSFVFGRDLTQTSAEALGGTNAMLWGCLTSPAPFIPPIAVDVRDVASAHLKALEISVGKSDEVEEFILSAGEREGWMWGRVAEFVRERYPSVDVKLEGPFEEPPKVNTQKAEEGLGVKWRGMEDTVGSFLEQQMELRGQL